MDNVRILVLLDHKIHRVTGHIDDLLVDFYARLRDEVVAPRYTECKFYRPKTPVLARYGHLDETREECLKAGHREEFVEPLTTKVRDLADNFEADYIYLVIHTCHPSTESDAAIQRLREKHGALFWCLNITVQSLDQACPEDVVQNMDGGILTETIDRLPFELKDIRDALEKRRLYEVAHETTLDFKNAQSYDVQFARVFEPCGIELPMVTNVREFTAFYNVLRCFHEDAPSIYNDRSLLLKATAFTTYFIHPVFLSENQSQNYVYCQDDSWRIPIFLRTESSQNTCCRLIPKSGNMVGSPLFNVPFVFFEMISENEDRDRSQILVEATALARAGQFLMKSTSKKRFFVVAICLNTSLVASRYIVMQTGKGNNTDHEVFYRDRAVCIHRKDFNLRHDGQSVDFLREMYNLEAQINDLAREVDKDKWRSLTNIIIDADMALSRSMVCQPVNNQDGSRGQENPDGPRGIFESEEIQNILLEMNYRILRGLWGHTAHLAQIVSNTSEEYRFLKFVENHSNEVNILRSLTNICSSSNHTISDIQFWSVEGGTLMSMPAAGCWLTFLDIPVNQLWSVALQLFEAVAFMHEHNVAHMSLNPHHILIPFEGGRLSIIDFSSAIQLDDPDAKHVGVLGTKGFIAPEVYIGEYKPMLADLWSCGKTLEVLCTRTTSYDNSDRKKILEISRKLMDHDPEARPRMTFLLQEMASGQSDQDDVSSSLAALASLFFETV